MFDAEGSPRKNRTRAPSCRRPTYVNNLAPDRPDRVVDIMIQAFNHETRMLTKAERLVAAKQLAILLNLVE